MTRTRCATMSTELETSYGGVVLKGDELAVITPAGKRVPALPKGGVGGGVTREPARGRGGGGGARAGGAPRAAGGDGRRGERALVARRCPLRLPARRPAGAQDRALL